MKKNICFLSIFFISFFLLSGWSTPSFFKKKEAGNLYNKEEYSKALDIYQDLQIDYPYNEDINYNKGNTLYRLGKYNEAENAFKKALQSRNPDVLKKVHYNIGNALYRQDKLEEAIKSYEETLRIDSTDQDAVYNIEFIKKKLQSKQQEKQEEEKQDKNKKPDKKDEQNNRQDQQKKGGKKQQENQENKSENKSNEENKLKQENKEKNKPGSDNNEKNEKADVDKKDKNGPEEKAKHEQARQILDAIKQDEKKVKQILHGEDEFTNNEKKAKYDW